MTHWLIPCAALAFATAAFAGAPITLLQVQEAAWAQIAEPVSPVRAVPDGPGPLQQEIVQDARALAGKRIKYARATNGGRRGCAQVASTILKQAGAVKHVRLSVRDVVRDLYGHGWEPVKPPPYKDGDVITWKTYDRDGDGRKDPDTHIGVVLRRGGTTYVVDNSTRQRRVVMRELAAMPYPVSRVMRKDGGHAFAD